MTGNKFFGRKIFFQNLNSGTHENKDKQSLVLVLSRKQNLDRNRN